MGLFFHIFADNYTEVANFALAFRTGSLQHWVCWWSEVEQKGMKILGSTKIPSFWVRSYRKSEPDPVPWQTTTQE